MKETLQKLIEAVEARCYGTGILFEPVELQKNNGVTRYGVQVQIEESKLAKVVYVEDIISMMKSGKLDKEEAAEEFEKVYIKVCQLMISEEQSVKDFADDIFQGKEKILENVKYTLLNRKWNKTMLCKIPHKTVLDLIAVYELISKNGKFSCKITYEMMEKYGITIQELDEAAKKNKEEYIINNIFDAMISMFPDEDNKIKELEEAKEQCCDFPQYVITCKSKIKGASVMLYPEYFETLANKLHSDLYIIPSSIHEIIVMPDDLGIPADEVTNVISMVNGESLEAEYKLSDHVYLYKRGSMQIVM